MTSVLIHCYSDTSTHPGWGVTDYISCGFLKAYISHKGNFGILTVYNVELSINPSNDMTRKYNLVGLIPTIIWSYNNP
ncbi:hypothetical protein Hanom_Chr16g01508121 [Helianthus anomalus]